MKLKNFSDLMNSTTTMRDLEDVPSAVQRNLRYKLTTNGKLAVNPRNIRIMSSMADYPTTSGKVKESIIVSGAVQKRHNSIETQKLSLNDSMNFESINNMQIKASETRMSDAENDIDEANSKTVRNGLTNAKQRPRTVRADTRYARSNL